MTDLGVEESFERDRGSRGPSGPEAIIRILEERKVRFLTAEQVAKKWFGHTKDPKRHSLRCLRNLQEQCLVTLSTAMLKDVDVSEPLFRWPEDGTPHFGQIAWKAQARFLESTPQSTVIALPAKGFSGRSPRIPRPTELMHDTLMGNVLLHLLATDESVFDRWQLEDAVRETFLGRTHLPDAVLQTTSGVTYIECVGQYSKSTIERIHNSFVPTPHIFY